MKCGRCSQEQLMSFALDLIARFIPSFLTLEIRWHWCLSTDCGSNRLIAAFLICLHNPPVPKHRGRYQGSDLDTVWGHTAGGFAFTSPSLRMRASRHCPTDLRGESFLLDGLVCLERSGPHYHSCHIRVHVLTTPKMKMGPNSFWSHSDTLERILLTERICSHLQRHRIRWNIPGETLALSKEEGETTYTNTSPLHAPVSHPSEHMGTKATLRTISSL